MFSSAGAGQGLVLQLEAHGGRPRGPARGWGNKEGTQVFGALAFYQQVRTFEHNLRLLGP